LHSQLGPRRSLPEEKKARRLGRMELSQKAERGQSCLNVPWREVSIEEIRKERIVKKGQPILGSAMATRELGPFITQTLRAWARVFIITSRNAIRCVWVLVRAEKTGLAAVRKTKTTKGKLLQEDYTAKVVASYTTLQKLIKKTRRALVNSEKAYCCVAGKNCHCPRAAKKGLKAKIAKRVEAKGKGRGRRGTKKPIKATKIKIFRTGSTSAHL